MEKTTLSANETALRIGISKSKALELIEQGEIPAIRIGRNWLVPDKALQDWLCTRAYAEANERRERNGRRN